MIVVAEINEHTFGLSVPFPTRPKDHEVFTLSKRMHSVLSDVLRARVFKLCKCLCLVVFIVQSHFNLYCTRLKEAL